MTNKPPNLSGISPPHPIPPLPNVWRTGTQRNPSNPKPMSSKPRTENRTTAILCLISVTLSPLSQELTVNQPQSGVREASEFIISCTAQGSSRMQFQWFKDGAVVNASKSTRWVNYIHTCRSCLSSTTSSKCHKLAARVMEYGMRME